MDEIVQGTEIEVLKPQNITISPQKVKKEFRKHFTKEEMIFLLSRLPPDKYGMLLQFLWRTGCRVTEAISIRKADIDFQNNEIKIRWLKNRKYHNRIIALHQSLKIPLWSFVANLKSEDRVFPFTRQYIHYICKKHGFDHPHKIRHSFAVNFLRQSNRPMALVELKEILGHGAMRTTLEYLKIVPENQKKALEAISFD